MWENFPEENSIKLSKLLLHIKLQKKFLTNYMVVHLKPDHFLHLQPLDKFSLYIENLISKVGVKYAYM